MGENDISVYGISFIMEFMIDKCDFLFLTGVEELFIVGLGIIWGFFGFPGRGPCAIVVSLRRVFMC